MAAAQKPLLKRQPPVNGRENVREQAQARGYQLVSDAASLNAVTESEPAKTPARTVC
ncbi:hypothetical protein ACLK1X_02305 [Escherichia coli]